MVIMASSVSSAFPPDIGGVSKFSRVHEVYKGWRQVNPAKNPIIDFRRVVPEDVSQLEELHKELFPIVYDSQFYNGIASGITHGWVAVWRLGENLEQGFPADEEFVIGFITTSQDSRVIKDNDYKYVIKSIPESFLSQELREKITDSSFEISPSPFGACNYKYLVYVLTMGVVEEFRFLGLAKQLLSIVIGYYQKFCPDVNAIYLHVVDYNQSAINLYKRMKFEQVLHWKNFYKILDNFYGSYLYAYNLDRSGSINIFDTLVNSNSGIELHKKKFHLLSYLNQLIPGKNLFRK